MIDYHTPKDGKDLLDLLIKSNNLNTETLISLYKLFKLEQESTKKLTFFVNALAVMFVTLAGILLYKGLL